jgi:2,3,4,5-tetrahydropyridine-2,6-dicarboxylate N-succinyltransferase
MCITRETGPQVRPLVVPPGAVVVPGTRQLHGGRGAAFAAEDGLSVAVALLVKDRDAGTSARVALDGAQR